MVLQHARSWSQSSRPHPNPARVVGMAGAIALNVAMLMLLLVPFATPVAVPRIGEVIYDVFPREKIRPPLPPPVVPITRHQITTPHAQVRPDIAKPVVEQVVVDDGTLQADPIVELPAIDSAQASIEPNGPIAGVRLEYAHAPSPPYPRDALLDGLQGTVMLQILVDVDGRPLEVSIHKSSGYRKLDEAARRFVLKQWSFRPAMKDGRAVQAIGLVPIAFNLDR